uniref:Uncharacterized protein n=1 Tax=Phaeomonas parva TaxID=124430 RepID=A0A7S1UDW2_9STRA
MSVPLPTPLGPQTTRGSGKAARGSVGVALLPGSRTVVRIGTGLLGLLRPGLGLGLLGLLRFGFGLLLPLGLGSALLLLLRRRPTDGELSPALLPQSDSTWV